MTDYDEYGCGAELAVSAGRALVVQPPFILRPAQDERLPMLAWLTIPALTVILAQAGIQNPGGFSPHRHSDAGRNPETPAASPSPSFRRRPESRTPVAVGVSGWPGVDSRFRGNDGQGRRE